jgi:hypothetical protein
MGRGSRWNQRRGERNVAEQADAILAAQAAGVRAAAMPPNGQNTHHVLPSADA